MAKGSRLARLIEYFRSADIEEAKYVYQRAGDIVSERQIPQTIQKKLALGTRKKRRTKAQIEGEKQAVTSLGKAVTHLEDAAKGAAAAAGE
jgi:hypothetical protein